MKVLFRSWDSNHRIARHGAGVGGSGIVGGTGGAAQIPQRASASSWLCLKFSLIVETAWAVVVPAGGCSNPYLSSSHRDDLTRQEGPGWNPFRHPRRMLACRMICHSAASAPKTGPGKDSVSRSEFARDSRTQVRAGGAAKPRHRRTLRPLFRTRVAAALGKGTLTSRLTFCRSQLTKTLLPCAHYSNDLVAVQDEHSTGLA